MDCSPPGSSIHGIFQARVLEWGAIAFSATLSYKLLKCTKMQQWLMHLTSKVRAVSQGWFALSVSYRYFWISLLARDVSFSSCGMGSRWAQWSKCQWCFMLRDLWLSLLPVNVPRLPRPAQLENNWVFSTFSTCLIWRRLISCSSSWSISTFPVYQLLCFWVK